VLGGGDEVGEGGALVQQPALLVPGPSHLAPAPYVGHGVEEAAVDQREAGGSEERVQAHLVGAVAVEEGGPGPVPGPVAAVEDGDGDAGPVLGRGPQPLADVVGRVVAAQHRFLFEHDPLTAVEVVVDDGPGGYQAAVPATEDRAVDLVVLPHPGGVDGFGLFDLL